VHRGVILRPVIIAIVVLLAAALAVAVVSEALARRTRQRNARLAADLARSRAAAEADERLRTAAFDHLPVAALRVDGSGTIRETNALARDKFPHVAPGHGILASFGEHRFAEEVAQAVATGEPRLFELRLFSAERRTFRVSVEPIGAAAGYGAFVFMTDFTDAVAYQELRSQFSANVSHELRTPLTGLAGLIEALGDPEIDRVTHARFVDRASSEIQRLVALITDVLFLSELEATQEVGPSGRSDLRVAIASAVEALRDVAAEHDVSITVDADDAAWAPLTERMATIVVQNLVENAVKYGGPGSQTHVRASVTDDGDWVQLSCRDTGPGIAERHLPHIFERFYRADASRSKRLGGTGLGLSIVKHIAERSGGTAEARSREGFGTTVVVRLPVALRRAPVADTPAREDAPVTTTR
jgi:two-component system, OmpR family, phosphate regulon sensor histidine kinase PhoR